MVRPFRAAAGRRLAAGALLLLGAHPAWPQEEPSERAYRLAAEFLREGKPELAADALDRFVGAFPDSDRVDDALYLRATLAFPPRLPEALGRDAAAGAQAARAPLERIRAEHPTGDRTADALYLLGLSYLVPDPIAAPAAAGGGHDPERALALFREVLEVHPGSPAEVAALGAAAVAELRAGRPGRALLFLERALWAEPQGDAAVRNRLRAADAWLRLGDADAAMVALAPLVDGRSPTVAAARDLLTVLVRMQPPVIAHRAFRPDPAWGVAPVANGPAVALGFDGDGGLHVLTADGSALARAGAAGALEEGAAVRAGRCLFREPGGGVGWASESELHLASGPFVPQRADGGKARKVDGIADVAQAADGTLYVLEGSGREVLRFRAGGGFAGVAAEARSGVALEVDGAGRLYVLDDKDRAVASYLPDGSPAISFDLSAGGADLREPIDVAVDDAYHVYVLDGRGAFAAFGSAGDLRAVVQPDEAGLDALRDPRRLAVDRSGAVIVLDDRGRVLRRFR